MAAPTRRNLMGTRDPHKHRRRDTHLGGFEVEMTTYKVGRLEKAANMAATFLVRVGVGSDKTYLLTVVGRNTGRPYTTPVTVLVRDGERWLVGPYGNVAWARTVTGVV